MDFIHQLGIRKLNSGVSTGTSWLSPTREKRLKSRSPIDGKVIASVRCGGAEELEQILATAQESCALWQQVPPPQRGDIVRQIGLELREQKEALGRLVSLEMGKSLQEGYGEVQEMIDICDFAVGQSRLLSGATLQSERPLHRIYDQYHPLGLVGIVTAFNFPVAVWSWNAMISAVCGNVNIWKPSSLVPLTAIAVQHLIGRVLRSNQLPEGIFSLVIGSGRSVGQAMLQDPRIPLISFTGSVATGRQAAQTVAARLGKSILELGGNNAIIITPQADLKLAIPAVVFGAVGTAGQRCTTTRRLIVHKKVYKQVKEALITAYQSLRIGSPLDPVNHVGPLVNQEAVAAYEQAVTAITAQGGRIIFGGKVLSGKGYASGCYVMPTLVEAEPSMPLVREETFAPILYLLKYKGALEQAIAIQNGVSQGLSSAIFTTGLAEAETFLSNQGSDCGIANVNLGTSGSEIGGAFGGEKETGGGREAGSDAWKAYMRRQTVTINHGTALPLAQGITFQL
ncbi:L-piperidine-6-carboxylate dehydrogenase [Desulfogranum mediterraneum]|uniref:L-piperidine-6-carboxylate dehydrogenase n=1 Tax=Desulfogranum mediterraneum TaxID=160661 RepID=UPI00041245FF|nr:aldehyde dehydrogenase family protein [Desulfogranum mediterraneum]